MQQKSRQGGERNIRKKKKKRRPGQGSAVFRGSCDRGSKRTGRANNGREREREWRQGGRDGNEAGVKWERNPKTEPSPRVGNNCAFTTPSFSQGMNQMPKRILAYPGLCRTPWKSYKSLVALKNDVGLDSNAF